VDGDHIDADTERLERRRLRMHIRRRLANAASPTLFPTPHCEEDASSQEPAPDNV
jgi:hypothetical protein